MGMRPEWRWYRRLIVIWLICCAMHVLVAYLLHISLMMTEAWIFLNHEPTPLGNYPQSVVVAMYAPLCIIISSPFFGFAWATLYVAWKKRRRTRQNHCTYCGWSLSIDYQNKCRVCGVPNEQICHNCQYNLTGNESGRCPECGQAIESLR